MLAGARGLGRHLAQWPVAREEVVWDVPSTATARVRELSRGNDLTPTEDAVARALRGWGADLDIGQKFWWHDWNRTIRDAVEAMRMSEPVLYDDEQEAGEEEED